MGLSKLLGKNALVAIETIQAIDDYNPKKRL